MQDGFTSIGEYRRGKGNRKSRLATRFHVGTGKPISSTHRYQTADQIATNKLGKLLENRNISAGDRNKYQKLMMQAGQVRFMYMPALAEVITFIHVTGLDNIKNQPEDETDIATQNQYGKTNIKINFDRVSPYVDRLLTFHESYGTNKELQGDDLEITRYRLGATFLRYLRYVINLIMQQEEELREAQEKGELYQIPYEEQYATGYDRGIGR